RIAIGVRAREVSHQAFEHEVTTADDGLDDRRDIALRDAQATHTRIHFEVEWDAAHLLKGRILVQTLDLAETVNHRRQVVTQQLGSTSTEVAAHHQDG